ncbi:MAG: DUF1109 family protein [Bdellovibrionaceae bacterium]|nr:DUF1109 family protein [Pseudobdellovibrionaceae bacterium]
MINQDSFIESLSDNLQPVQPLASTKKRFLGLLVLSISIMLLGMLYWYWRTGEIHFIEDRSFIEGLLLMSAGFFSAFLLTKSLSPHTVQFRLAKTPIFSMVLWLLVLVIAFVAVYMQTPSEALVAWQYNTWLCPIVIVSILIPIGFFSLWFIKQGAVLYPKATFLYWAMAMTSFGALGLSFICPWTDPLHELLWHVLPSSLFIGIGYVAARAMYRLLSSIKNR